MNQVDIDKLIFALRFYLRASAGCRVVLTGAYTATFAVTALRHVAKMGEDRVRRHAFVFTAPGGEFVVEDVVKVWSEKAGMPEVGLWGGRAQGEGGPVLKFVLLHADGRQTRMVLTFRPA